MIRCLGLCGVILLASLSLPCAAKDKPYGCDESERNSYDHADYPWQQMTPLEYLTYIRFLPQNGITVYGCKEGWVKEADVPALLELLDSKEPCPNQMSVYSSSIDVNKSTVGNEAAWLIEAFRVGRFPPGLRSTRPPPDAAELRRWWKERRQRPATRPTDTSAEPTREK